jgi:hypothetical protein
LSPKDPRAFSFFIPFYAEYQKKVVVLLRKTEGSIVL